MIQVYFLTLIYFIFTSLMLFMDEYRLTLGFMFSLKHQIIVNKKFRLFLFFSGLALFVFNLLLPMDPGPRIIGDLFPALVCFFVSLYFYRYDRQDRKTYLKLSDRTCGIMLSAFTLVHFLGAGLVLI